MEIKELDYKERIINLFGDICEDSVKNTIEKIENKSNTMPADGIVWQNKQ